MRTLLARFFRWHAANANDIANRLGPERHFTMVGPPDYAIKVRCTHADIGIDTYLNYQRQVGKAYVLDQVRGHQTPQGTWEIYFQLDPVERIAKVVPVESD